MEGLIGPVVGVLLLFSQVGPGFHPKTKPPVYIKACPHIVQHSKEWQQDLANELPQVKPIVRQALTEWLNLRDQARKCQSSGKRKK